MENLKKNSSFFLKMLSGVFGKSLRPYVMGSGAAIAEMKTVLGSKYHFTNLDIEVLNQEPESADVLVLCGSVTYKMLPFVQEAYKRMLGPKWIIWLGSVDGKKTTHESYSIVKSLDKYLDIDIYVEGEPPTPEQIMDGFLKLRDKIKDEK
mgnify:CR=1 FL=1